MCPIMMQRIVGGQYDILILTTAGAASQRRMLPGNLVPGSAFLRREGLGGDPPRLHGGQQRRHQGVVEPARADDGPRQLPGPARQRRALECRTGLQVGVL